VDLKKDRARGLPLLFKITAAKEFLYQAVQNDEKVTAAHFLYFQIGRAVFPVLP